MVKNILALLSRDRSDTVVKKMIETIVQLLMIGTVIVTTAAGANLQVEGASITNVSLDTNSRSAQLHVTSSDPSGQMKFVVALTQIYPGVAWLDAQQGTGTLTTPATITIALTPLAENLTASFS